MSTPFLVGFAQALVTRLVDAGSLEVAPGTEARVVLFLSNWLGTAARGGSLLSQVEKGLLSCPEVLELFADQEELKGLIEDLKA